MQTIKLIEKSTDISSLKMYKFDWDVEVNDWQNDANMVVEEILASKLQLVKKEDYNPYVRKYVKLKDLSIEEIDFGSYRFSAKTGFTSRLLAPSHGIMT